MTLADRLTDIMKREDITQSKLARAVGVTQQTIGKLVRGDALNSVHLHKIAKHLGTSVEYLTGETDDVASGSMLPSMYPRNMSQSDIAMIPQYEMGFSMGGGSFADHAEQNGVMPFQRKWLKEIMKGAFGDLFVARGDGDSMVPTMMDGDIVLIDRAQQQIVMQDRIWALSYGDLAMIKRVRKLPDGGYQINSDNSAVSPITAYDGEMHVIGRVIWIGRKM